MRNNDKTKLHENLKQEIRSLLISSPKTKYGGLSGSLLYSDYKKLNSGKEIPYGELGFHSFLALLRSMPDVVRIEYKENSPSYRVHPVYDETTAHIQKMVFEQRDKYEYQNQLYSQNWYSNNDIRQNKLISLNFYNNRQRPFLYNTFSRFPQKLFISNEGRKQFSFQPYLLVTSTHDDDKKINFQSINKLTSINNHKNELEETPPNFDLNDYHLSESIEQDTDEQTNNNSTINHQIG
ncbi:unnamed protein product [Rotaria sp. Silwood1]|nr:unnamed protein product [Rotaria sp. Silwood1]